MPGRKRHGGPGRPFPKGHRSPGRPKGRKNNATLVTEFLMGKNETLALFAKGSEELGLKPRHERIANLLLTASAAVVAPLERELMLHDWGKPKETVEISGKVDVATAIGKAFARARSSARDYEADEE